MTNLLKEKHYLLRFYDSDSHACQQVSIILHVQLYNISKMLNLTL